MGLSVNKEVEVENMKRIICDHVKSVGGSLNVDLRKELIMSVKGGQVKT